MKILNILTLILVLVGALNWGLIGLFGFNLVEFLFHGGMVDRVIYALVGLSALWQIFVLGKEGRHTIS